MSHIPHRWHGSHQWYFVTVVTIERKFVFNDFYLCRKLQEAFRFTRKNLTFRLAALTILPDHWHGLICPAAGLTIGDVVGSIKQNFIKMKDDRGNKTSCWQTRFLDHRIRSEEDFNRHVEYIRINAAKHEYVSKDVEYQWCFIHPDPFSGTYSVEKAGV